MEQIQQKSNIEKIKSIFLKDNSINKPIKIAIRKIGLYQSIYSLFDKLEMHNEISMKYIKKLISKDNPIVLEIGAHIGQDTVRFLKTFRNITIYSFEPDPRSVIQFKKNVKNPNSKLISCAISDKNGYITLNQSTGSIDYVGGKEKINDWTASSTLKNPLKQSNFVRYEKKIKVKTIKLDYWVKKNKIPIIDFMWADVEGAERELIIGGQETLNKKTRYFYTEFFDDPVYEDQASLKEIKNMLPEFKVIGIFGNNVLMRNENLINS